MRTRLRVHMALSFVLALCSGLFILAPAARAGAASAAGAPPDFGAVDLYVAGQVRDLRVPGLALGIVRGDRIVHLQSFGVADPDGAAVTPQTPFMLGSTTKSFTALAIMQLVEAGKIQLDAPVQAYLPWFRVADPLASSRITVRDLLDHTSGLPTLAGADQQEPDTSDRALETSVRRLAGVELDRRVGNTWEYSNVNYVILGAIVQTVSGEPYETYIQEHIFVPLEMTHSYTSGAEADKHGLATGYRYWFQFPVSAPGMYLQYNRSYVPAEALVSSAEDMSRYLIAQLNGGIYDGRRVLQADGVRQMQSPEVSIDNNVSYAMGWEVSSPYGVPAISHSGDLAGYHSDMVLIPSGQGGGWGIVVLANVNSMLAPAAMSLRDVAWGVAWMLTGREILPPRPNAVKYWLPVGFGVALFLVMLARLACSVRNIARWRRRRPLQPARGGTWALQAGIPLLTDAAVATFFLVGVPVVTQGSLAGVELWQPDLFWLLGLSFLAAITWAPVRTLLTVWVLRPRTLQAANGALPYTTSRVRGFLSVLC